MKLANLLFLLLCLFGGYLPVYAQADTTAQPTLVAPKVDSVQVLLLKEFDIIRQPNRYFTIGLSANAYKGSLNASYQAFKPAFHIGLQLNRKKRLNGSFNLAIGSYVADKGPDPNFYPAMVGIRIPNTFASSTFIAFHYGLNLYVIKNRYFNWYLGTGFGLMRFNPQDAEGSDLLDQRFTRESNENYSTVTSIIPVNTGVNYFHKSGYGLGFQVGWWNTNTQYLDNVGKLASEQKNDNILSYRFSLLVPFSTAK
jgi:hypothetical protein